MPQFDTSTFISQIFWLAICLGMVIFCYVRIFIPKFNQTIEKRLSKIRYDVEQAEHMQEQAKLLFEKSQKKIEDAHRHIEAHLKETLEGLEIKKKLQLTHIDDELSGSLKDMEKSFERQQLQLQESMEPLANDCLNQILAHIVGNPNQTHSPSTSNVSPVDKRKKKVSHVTH
jgi:F-type H+-transporting ATPase subunit b